MWRVKCKCLVALIIFRLTIWSIWQVDGFLMYKIERNPTQGNVFSNFDKRMKLVANKMSFKTQPGQPIHNLETLGGWVINTRIGHANYLRPFN